MNPVQELFSLLRCPVTGSGLDPVDSATLETWNRRIAQGQVDSRSGRPVRRHLEAAFFNADRSLMIPVHDGIIVMLVDQLIPIHQAATGPGETAQE